MSLWFTSDDRKCLCLSLGADISLNTPHLSSSHHVQRSQLSQGNTCSLVHFCCSLQASALVTVGSMTSHRMMGGDLPEETGAECYRVLCQVDWAAGCWAGPTAPLLHHQDRSSSKHWLFVTVMVIVMWPYLPAFAFPSWPRIIFTTVTLANYYKILQDTAEKCILI